MWPHLVIPFTVWSGIIESRQILSLPTLWTKVEWSRPTTRPSLPQAIRCLSSYPPSSTPFFITNSDLNWLKYYISYFLFVFRCLLDWANPNCLGSMENFNNEFATPIKLGQRFDATKRELALARKSKFALFSSCHCICNVPTTLKYVTVFLIYCSPNQKYLCFIFHQVLPFDERYHILWWVILEVYWIMIFFCFSMGTAKFFRSQILLFWSNDLTHY